MGIKQTLTQLCGIYGPSGHEGRVADAIAAMLDGYVDEIRRDSLGNLIAVKRGSGKKLMLAAHMDQIGFAVTSIDGCGFLKVCQLGYIMRNSTVSRHVVFENGTRGVIHFEQTTGGMYDIDMRRMFIDIGASSREEAMKRVNIGDAAVWVNEFSDFGTRAASAAMDDRSGCAILVELARTLKTDNEIYYVFTVQEEVGTRGAIAAAYGIMPDIGLAVDITPAYDMPKSPFAGIDLGKGPAIKIMDNSVICHPGVVAMMQRAAENAGIPYQNEVLTLGGTDASAIQLSRGGVPSGALSIPTRYQHTCAEMIEWSDIEQSVALLGEIARGDLSCRAN